MQVIYQKSNNSLRVLGRSPLGQIKARKKKFSKHYVKVNVVNDLPEMRGS